MRRLISAIPLLVLISAIALTGEYILQEKPPETSPSIALAAELGLPEGYKAEFLLKPDLLSPLFITATSDDQLLVAEHYGSRLLRINPLTARMCLAVLPFKAYCGWQHL